MIIAATRTLVRERAAGRCEYCDLSAKADLFFAFHIEHIVARQHGGGDTPENLALACYHCNARKGTNLTAIDPATGLVVRLFHPRHDTWARDFSCNGNLIEGRTPTGRATVALLKMNARDRRRLRG